MFTAQYGMINGWTRVQAQTRYEANWIKGKANMQEEKGGQKNFKNYDFLSVTTQESYREQEERQGCKRGTQ